MYQHFKDFFCSLFGFSFTGRFFLSEAYNYFPFKLIYSSLCITRTLSLTRIYFFTLTLMHPSVPLWNRCHVELFPEDHLFS